MNVSREFVVATITNILATGIIFAGAWAWNVMAPSATFVAAATQSERLGSFSITRVDVQNPTSYAIDPLEFHCRVSPGATILRAGIRTDKAAAVSIATTTPPCWKGTLGSAEVATFILIVDNGSLEGGIEQQFTGKYRVIGARGAVEERDVIIRAETDARLARYVFAAKLTGLAVLGVAATTVVLVWKRRRRTRPPTASK